LKVSISTFEWKPDEVDAVSKFSLGTGGSVPGKTMQVGFEFVTVVEVNPAYMLQIIAHELYGHPTFDHPIGSGNYQGDLFTKAAGKTPAGTVADPTGSQNYAYWSSELYSWLLQIPYFKKTAAAEAGKVVKMPGHTDTVGALNYDPNVFAERWLQEIKDKWDPKVVVGLIRGFFKRLQNDPAVQKASVTAFAGMVSRVFAAPDAATILR
jgi:hypothetical protein